MSQLKIHCVSCKHGSYLERGSVIRQRQAMTSFAFLPNWHFHHNLSPRCPKEKGSKEHDHPECGIRIAHHRGEEKERMRSRLAFPMPLPTIETETFCLVRRSRSNLLTRQPIVKTLLMIERKLGRCSSCLCFSSRILPTLSTRNCYCSAFWFVHRIRCKYPTCITTHCPLQITRWHTR